MSDVYPFIEAERPRSAASTEPARSSKSPEPPTTRWHQQPSRLAQENRELARRRG